MLDGHERLFRELFLAGFSADIGGVEPWVTDRLTSILEEDFAPAGEALFRAGDPPDFFCFPRQGRVHVEGGEGTAAGVSEPRILGLFDVLLDRPRTTTAIAVTDVTFMKIPTDDWMELLEDSFALARILVLGLGRAAAEAEEWASSTAPTNPAGARPPRVPVSAEHLSLFERMATLLDVPLLRGAGVQALSDLASLTDELVFEAREPLFRAGEPRDRIYLLIDGEVSAVRERPHRERRWTGGQIVCDVASFGEPARSWGAVAARRSRALAFRVEDWFDLMETHFEMLRSTLAVLATAREQWAVSAPGGDVGAGTSRTRPA